VAGSFQHCLDDDHNYRGTDLLENMADMAEAVEHMAFMLLYIRMRIHGGADLVRSADEAFFRCARGEDEWPKWWKHDG
jgi:hypothetical protein